MRIIFLGTPDFSVPVLERLLDSKHTIVAVITQPDKKRNRGEVTFSPVKECALRHNLQVLQYDKIRLQGVEDIKALNPDIMVTVAYGQIISQQILDIPRFGVVNVHASLLPKYRGSSPIQQAIAHGEKYTGITIMQTALGVDCGDIILQKQVEILQGETAGELFDRLSLLGGDELLQALEMIENGSATFTRQDESLATHFPMLQKDDGRIDWTRSAEQIVWHIAAMDPWPSAFSYLDGKLLKVWKARACETTDLQDGANLQKKHCECETIDLQDESASLRKVGEIFVQHNRCFVRAGKGIVELFEVQAEGKKRMSVQAFLLGNKITKETILS
ncbi:MAG: methionyl-tRNA formyltransferase [Clostridia bacterium]